MARRRDELASALDHPIFFSLVITLGVVALMAVFTWILKSVGLPGAAALYQHP